MTNQNEPTYPPHIDHDEIELINYLRVIRKWKYLILIGTFLCTLTAGVVSFLIPKTYRIDMLIDCGVVDTSQAGDKTCLVDPKQLKVSVELSSYNHELLKYAKQEYKTKLPTGPSFKVSVQESTRIMTISHETTNIDLGTKLLLNLHSLLQQKYLVEIKSREENYQNQIESTSKGITELYANIEKINKDITAIPSDVKREKKELFRQIDYITDMKNVKKNKIKELKSLMNHLHYEIDSTNKNITFLVQERNEILSNKSKHDSRIIVTYTDMIQQNHNYLSNIRKEITQINEDIGKEFLETKKLEGEILKIDYNINNIEDQVIEKKHNLNKEIERIKDEITSKNTEIANLEAKKNNIQNVRILQPPKRSLNALRPRTKLNVMLATVTGFFGMLFLGFVLEYLFKYKKMLKDKDVTQEDEENRIPQIDKR